MRLLNWPFCTGLHHPFHDTLTYKTKISINAESAAQKSHAIEGNQKLLRKRQQLRRGTRICMLAATLAM